MGCGEPLLAHRHGRDIGAHGPAIATGSAPLAPSSLLRFRKKLRRLEITTGAKKNTRRAAGVWTTNDLMRVAERELAEQAELSYRRTVTDQKAGGAGQETWARARHVLPRP